MNKKLIYFFTVLFAVLVLSTGTNAEPRRMVLEFCTGTWCGWCPCGDQAAEQILTTYPGTIVIAYHGASTDPWQNFNGNAIRSMLGFAAYPTGIFDRTNHPGNGSNYPYIDYTLWAGMANTSYTNVPNTLINVVVGASSYNAGTREVSVTINATALQNLPDQYKIVYVMTEDNVVYPQNYYAPCGTPGYHNDYIHKWIARSVLNSPSGENMNSGTWMQNQMITKTITGTVDNQWVAQNCNVIAIVYKDNPSGLFLSTVEQGINKPLSGLVGIIHNQGEIPSEYGLSQNYPNPFNPTTNIKFSIPKSGNVSLKIYNSMGQEVATYLEGYVNAGVYNADVDGTNLSSGIYFYTLRAGDFIETKKMMLVK